MTRAYYSEDQKLITQVKTPGWTFDEGYQIRDILYDKGYFTNHVTRIGADKKTHDALQVSREDIPRLIEQLFRQRIPVEVQPEGHGLAGIIFVYDHPAVIILNAVEKFQKNMGRR